MNTPAVAATIRDARTFMLPGIIQTGKRMGMQLMDDSLVELFQKGIISAEETVARGEQKQMLRDVTGHH